MKKALSLLLVLAMCLSLCACGGGETVEQAEAATTTATKVEENTYEEVRKALVGQWGYLLFNDRPSATVMEFKENGTGSYLYYTLISNTKKIDDGFVWKILSYKITDSNIIIERETPNSGTHTEVLDYILDNGTLYLSINNTREYHKDNWIDGIIELLRKSGANGLKEEHKNYIDYE